MTETNTEINQAITEINQAITEINQAKMEIIQAKEELKDSIMQAQKKQFWLVVSAGTIAVVTIIGTNLAVILNF